MMDVLSLYSLGVLLCLPLSWYVNRYLFMESSFRKKLSYYLNSAAKYYFFLFVFLSAPMYLLFTHHRLASSLILSIIYEPTFRSLRSGIFAVEPFVFVMIGSILFQYGFNKMKDWNTIRDIPLSRIGSAAIGLTEISGHVRPEQTLVTPYTKSPCVYFQCDLFEYRSIIDPKYHSSLGWDKIHSFAVRAPFWLEDESGQILVDSLGAEIMLSPSNFGLLDREGTYQVDLSEKETSEWGDKKFVEYFISPGDLIYAIGTVDIKKNVSPQHVVLHKGNEHPTFIIADVKEKNVYKKLKWETIAGVSYGIIFFMTGIIEIFRLSRLI